MSGAGRKHRAKHLVAQYLDDDWAGPRRGEEQLCVCVGPPISGKHVHVLLLPYCYETRTGEPETAGDQMAAKDGPDEAVAEGLQKAQGKMSKAVKSPPAAGRKNPLSHAVPSRRAAVDGLQQIFSAYDAAIGTEPSPPTTGSQPYQMLFERAIVSLPGKFKKVLWLASGDLIVVHDSCVHYKPSPEQLDRYLSQHCEEYDIDSDPLPDTSTTSRVIPATMLRRLIAIGQEAAKLLHSGNKNRENSHDDDDHGPTKKKAFMLSGSAKFSAKSNEAGRLQPTVDGWTSRTCNVAAPPYTRKPDKLNDYNNLDALMERDANPNRTSIKHYGVRYYYNDDEEESEENSQDEEGPDADDE